MPDAAQTWNPDLYQSAHSFVWRKAADLIELLAPKPGERVLDLGCGTGQLTAKIAERGADVFGIDRSAEMVEQAKKNVADIRFERGDATTFTIDRPVDAVFSNATLHWVKPPEDAVKRIFAALRPGGRFVAEFGGKGNVQHICDAAATALRDLAGVDFDSVNPWYYPSIAEYASLLETEGFSVTFATLFERLTPLEGDDGLKNWVRMFGASLLDRIPGNKRDALLSTIENYARPHLLRDGKWFADYVRLRVVAKRPGL